MPAASRGGWDAEANAPKHRFVDRGGLRAKLLCGLSRACGPDEMAVRVVSGPDTDSASVCVNGDEAIKSSKSRRGMNVVVVHGASKKIVESMSFDTYSHDGTELAEFLGGINDGRIVIMATADDAAFRLGDRARAAIRALGSAKIDSLNFRGSWVFVGQKGMKGTTVYEEVDPAELGLWSNGVEFAGCVPIKVDAGQIGYAAHRSFCRQFEGYGSFCSVDWISKSLAPAPPDRTRSLFSHTLPIAIMASSSRGRYLVQCLQSLMSLPGVNKTLITVFLDGYTVEAQKVVNLFGLRSVMFPKTISTSSMEQIFKNADIIAAHYYRSLDKVWELYPRKEHVIVLEEDLIVAPDFLNYFHYLLPLLTTDKKLLTISAWNDNGYLHSSSNNTLLYRSEFFPGLGWILSHSLWKELKGKWPPCCYGWSWDLWLREPAQRKNRDSIYPDVSRTYHIGRNGLNVNGYYFDHYFRDKALNKDPVAQLPAIDSMLPSAYDGNLNRLLSSGKLLSHASDTNPCQRSYIPWSRGAVFVLYYHQDKDDDVKHIQKICKCLRLWDLGVRGLYKGVLRFHYKGSHILAVGSLSPFARDHMPSSIHPLRLIV
ncbi:protein O-linked-mannose beta-1,2-N-acetylglucosaminyltransferase 1-like isoform X2 [Corticium candelabrum]|nr:protein O-linked-mannose beta-1,2-N-acetylglucosaminyltransferase 1-like isoform X2 [Corticium candelabrum]